MKHKVRAGCIQVRKVPEKVIRGCELTERNYFAAPILFSVPFKIRFMLARCFIKISMAMIMLNSITGGGQEKVRSKKGIVVDAVSEARET